MHEATLNTIGQNAMIGAVIADFITDGVSTMTAIFPSVALKNQQREIKAIADKEFVHITENGRGKYLFVAEDVFNDYVENAIEDALYEQRLIEALEQSRRDFAEGRYYTSHEEMWAAVERKRAQNAKA